MWKQWLWMGVSLWVGLTLSVTAQADADYDQALATAPQGILLQEGQPILTPAKAPMNEGYVVNTTNPQTLNTQALALTTGPGQFGAVWSTPENYFDLTRNQHFSFWTYLGNQGKKAGEGLAFVLQNDARGIGAAASLGKGGPVGETLGVWGVDNNPKQQYVTNIARGAIQNSWALEFDTGFNAAAGNKAPGKANSFDRGYLPVHIASNYPGDPATYTRFKNTNWLSFLSPNSYYYGMKHQGAINDDNEPNFLSNGRWHHVTLDWNATTTKMTYHVNDRNPVTGQAQPGFQQTVSIDLQKIDSAGTGKATWGFSATTSNDKYENNLVVLTNTPGLIDTTATATLTNLADDQALESGDQLISGDLVKLSYRLKYNGGRRAWSEIVSHLQLPKQIQFHQAQLTYGNEPATSVSLADVQNGQLRLPLTHNLDKDTDTATLELVGTVKPVAKTQTVPETTSTFTSSINVNTADTPEFVINPHVALSLSVDNKNPNPIQPNVDTTVTGLAKLKTTADPAPQVTVYPTLNKQTLTPIPIKKDGAFKINLLGDQLQKGTNQLRLVAQTENGDATSPVTVNLSVIGELRFKTFSKTSSFQTGFLSGTDQTIKRQKDWQLVVQDTRGTGKKWSLLAQANPFTTPDGKKAIGNIIYDNGYGATDLDENATQIMQHVTNDAVDDGIVDVAARWDDDTGILFSAVGGAPAGKYQGSIVWTLADVPD